MQGDRIAGQLVQVWDLFEAGYLGIDIGGGREGKVELLLVNEVI